MFVCMRVPPRQQTRSMRARECKFDVEGSGFLALRDSEITYLMAYCFLGIFIVFSISILSIA